MSVKHPYAKYNNNKVLTKSPKELTLLHYEGAIKFCNIAMIGIEEKNIQKAHENITKAEAIIEELQSTLNYSYPVAQDFNNIYMIIVEFENSLEELRGMRDTWKQVMKNAKSM